MTDEASNAARDAITVESSAPMKGEAPASTEPAKVEKTDDVDAQNDPEGSATSDNGNDDQPSNGSKRGVGKRIDELTANWRAAERERDHWREMATRQQPAPEQKPQPTQAVSSDAEPTLESCDFDQAEFQKKWYSWKRSEEKREEKAQKEQEERIKRVSSFKEKEALFASENPDYETVARNPNVPITEQMAEMILETDNPPALAYYLGKNIEEAAAIANMSPTQAARAIGRIEAKISAPVQSQTPPKQAVTRAPPPVTQLSGSPQVQRDPNEMDQREYEEMRRKERAARGLPNR